MSRVIFSSSSWVVISSLPHFSLSPLALFYSSCHPLCSDVSPCMATRSPASESLSQVPGFFNVDSPSMRPPFCSYSLKLVVIVFLPRLTCASSFVSCPRRISLPLDFQSWLCATEACPHLARQTKTHLERACGSPRALHAQIATCMAIFSLCRSPS